MWKCKKCGKVYDDLCYADCVENRVPYHEIDVTESLDFECKCGGELEDAVQCDSCGEWFCESEVRPTWSCGKCFCDKCVEEQMTEENAIGYGDARKTEIEINSFVTFNFTKEEINEILLRELKQAEKKNIKEFCSDEIDDFADWLGEKK